MFSSSLQGNLLSKCKYRGATQYHYQFDHSIALKLVALPGGRTITNEWNWLQLQGTKKQLPHPQAISMHTHKFCPQAVATYTTNIQAWCVHLSTYLKRVRPLLCIYDLSILLFMQLVTNSYMCTYGLKWLCVIEIPVTRKLPILTVELPESTVMLTVARNHQLKRICSIHKTFR